jgi:hypothetical protein
MVDEMQPPSATTPSDKPSPKVVAFQFPPEFEDRKSLCQSPSWEAYDRRKKEKRDEKKEERRREEERKREDKRREEERKREEKRREEQRKREEKRKEEERKKEDEIRAQQNAAKKPLASKPRRLSKPPPASAQTLDEIKAASSTARPAPRTQKPRPNSALGLMFSNPDDNAERSTRKRSGSFTSLIRAPFEHRRASFDHSAEGGFIGGIKLEQERFDAEQRANEANIHPALRKTQENSRSPSPQRSPHPPATRAESAQRRAYPPITILTASSKTRSLAAPDLSRIDRLRARVGLKSAPRTSSADGRLDASARPAETKGFSTSNTSLPTYESSVEKPTASQSKEPPVPKSPGLTPEPLRLRTDKTGGAKRNINEKQLNIKIPQKDDGRSLEVSAKSSPMTPRDHNIQTKTKDNEPKLSDLMAKEGQEPSMLLPPLRPPRKSSKRSLATSSSASSPSTATPRLHSATTPSSGIDPAQDILGLFNAPYTPPSLELNPGGMTPKTRANEDTAKVADHDARVSSLGISTRPNTTVSKPTPVAEPLAKKSTEHRLKDTAKPSLGRLATDHSRTEKPRRRQPTSGDSERSLGNLILANRPISSASETSSSEELQYHSPMSTPGTSRPQSEKELTPVPTDTELGPALGERRKSTQLKHQIPAEELPLPPAYTRHHHRKPSQHSEIDKDIELDRIQAAARKVMAAFPPASPPRADRRTQSDPDVAASAGFLPKLKLQPLKRKDKSKLGQVTGATDLDKEKEGRRSLLGGHVRAKSAVHLPHIPKPHLAPPSPALSPMSLPTPTFHPPHSSSSSLDVSSKSLLQPTYAPRTSTDSRRPRPSTESTRDGDGAPVAKMFVECCGCKYYHDLPSRLYEAMVNPEAALSPGDMAAYKGSISMTVKCPWCQHDMSTKCCAGLAAMVYVKERLH